ncbi:MAG: hybrid sensor histidine kinase/response regulator [Leptolyngbya sp. SIO1D8]|nr:hybrid sensor histidine kinase/response regulator [Leptolyngbya sp. SIO1D8]
MRDKAKILMVDDVPANLEVITEILSSAGYTVATAISGERALKRLQTYDPDLILLDIQMPVMDGFETCRRIKELPDMANIPIIFITALSDSESIVKGFSLGAVDYISKPFQALELLARVNTHLQLHQLNYTLENRVAERTRKLEEALEQLKESQLQLIQQEKMSALGNLVAGVAHEINNPINSVSGNLLEMKQVMTDLLEHLALYQQQASTDEIQKHAKEIDLKYLLEDIPKMIDSMEKGCDRIRNISTSIRVFSRADKGIKTGFNLHEGLDSMLLILKPRLRAVENRPPIQVFKSYGNLPEIQCFPGQINQVFMNILANAIDALEEKNQGKLYEEIEANPNRIEIKTETADGQVFIHIWDNGIGMSEAVQKQIFDYLYTTKEVGKGTGLGLTISHRIIVESHSGLITVASVPNQGSKFILALPIQGEKPVSL